MKSELLTFFLLTQLSVAAKPEQSKDDWNAWVQQQAPQESPRTVDQRVVSKMERFQLAGPFLGMSERKDFWNTYALAVGGRYFFSENLGWEFLRVTLNHSVATSTSQQVRKATQYVPDSQRSRIQFSSSVLYSPVYGKYAWGSEKVVHFDLYGLAGLGARLGERQLQPFGEIGLGMNHYWVWDRFAIVPEYRMRVYSEKRTDTVMVFESLFQLGASWLF